MDQRLSKIVSYKGSPTDSIDFALLKACATRISASSLTSSQWESIKHLHILGSGASAETFPRKELSCYTDVSGTWMLIPDAEPHGIREILSFCGSLELLDIRFTAVDTLHLSDYPHLRELHIAHNQDCRTIYDLGRLPDLKILDISHMPQLKVLDVSKLTELEALTIATAPALCRVPGLEKLNNLKKLEITHTSVGPMIKLPFLHSLQTIILDGNKNLQALGKLPTLKSLEKLSLAKTSIGPELNVSGLSRLKYLNLANSESIVQVQGLSTLTGLEKLNLSRTAIGPSVDVSAMTKLKQLDLSYCRSLNQITGLCCLQALETLQMNGSSVSDVTDLSALKTLTFLNLAAMPIQSLDGIEFSPTLERLYLGRLPIRRIPDGIRKLRNLQRVNLRRLQLDELPDWLPELGLEFTQEKWGKGNYLHLYNTTVKGVDMSIFSQPQELILQWFEERKKHDHPTPLNEIKVVFLGDGEAGKSLTIERLMNDGKQPDSFDSNATPGIAISNRKYDIDGRTVHVHFWDFGGQEILHSMHRMFLTDRTLYVILLSARDDTQDDRARYWLHNLKSFAKGAPALLVLNKMDQNPSASVNERDLRAMYPALGSIIKMSALTDDAELFNRNFTSVLMSRIGSFETLESPFLPSWSRLKTSLQTMTSNYIRGPEYIQLCNDCGVANIGDTHKHLLKWFHDLGVSFCYNDSQKLEDYVILRPEWITNAIYIIIFNHHKELRNGILSHEAIHQMLRMAIDKPEEIRCVLPGVAYSTEEIEYVLNVVRKFYLSYLVRDGMEFLPMLCPRDSLPIADEYADHPDTVEFRILYDYLPNNVIHRLMIELRRELDINNVWRTGALFAQDVLGLSAVVKSDGNQLRLMIRSDDPNVSPGKYLKYLKRIIDEINHDLGIEVSSTEIIYKADGKTEIFDYDYLLQSQACGLEKVYSRIRRAPIPINDILYATVQRIDRDKETLIQKLITVCQQLQGDKDCWTRDENGLNTYVRDALRMTGYIVHDQTLLGTGAGGKNAGELDLEIRKDADKPWTIFEAMWIKERAQLTTWNNHLNKLVDNYNTFGLPFLVQVCYVACPRDQFDIIWNKHFEHLQTYAPTGYVLKSCSPVSVLPQNYEANEFLCAAKCTYTRSTRTSSHRTTVYHIFVRLGK